jgi:hypothetical protein
MRTLGEIAMYAVLFAVVVIGGYMALGYGMAWLLSVLPEGNLVEPSREVGIALFVALGVLLWAAHATRRG